jgi:hypothetical protein
MMWWDEFLASDLSLDEYITPVVEEAVAKSLAATPVEQSIDRIAAERAAAEQRIAELEYEKLVRDVLSCYGQNDSRPSVMISLRVYSTHHANPR